MKNLLLIVISSLMLFGCGLEIEDDPHGTLARDEEIKLKLEKKYESVEGLYRGHMVDADKGKKVAITIRLFKMPRRIGDDLNGEPRIIPGLKASVVIAGTGLDLSMLADLDQARKTLTLIMESTMGIGGATNFSFSGTIIDGVIEGDFLSKKGPEGHYIGTLQD